MPGLVDSRSMLKNYVSAVCTTLPCRRVGCVLPYTIANHIPVFNLHWDKVKAAVEASQRSIRVDVSSQEQCFVKVRRKNNIGCIQYPMKRPKPTICSLISSSFVSTDGLKLLKRSTNIFSDLNRNYGRESGYEVQQRSTGWTETWKTARLCSYYQKEKVLRPFLDSDQCAFDALLRIWSSRMMYVRIKSKDFSCRKRIYCPLYHFGCI